MIKLQEWQWPRKCVKCNKVLFSKYDGQYISCSCGSMVDQTPYYERVGAPEGGTHDDFPVRLTEEELKELGIEIEYQ